MTLRVYIAGLAGSGKTTMARKLAEELGFPLYELDKLVWTDNGRLKPLQERKQLVGKIGQTDRWIVEGINTGWSDPLIEHADLVVSLKVPMPVALWRIFWRHIKAELRRDNPHPGWLRLRSFMCVVARQYGGDDGPSTSDDPPFTQESIDRSLLRRSKPTLRNPRLEAVLRALESASRS